MVTSDDDSEVDITVQGDPEELDRLSKVGRWTCCFLSLPTEGLC
jgi:hypothetical protein